MNVVLLHNENAGDGGHARDDLLGILRRAGYRAEHHDLHAALETPAVLDRGEFVVAAGGDGSIRKVAAAMLGRNRPLAVLPVGTANNIARSLGLRGSIEEIVAGWAERRIERLDVGLARGPWGERPIFEGVGLGLISRGIRLIQQIDEAGRFEFESPDARLYRDLCVFAALAHEIQPLRTRLEVDGVGEQQDFLLLEILNIPRAGPGLVLAPEADPSDGSFDVVTADATERSDLEEKLRESLAGSSRRALPRRAARALRIETADCEIRLDDEIVPLTGRATIELRVRPGAIPMLVSTRRQGGVPEMI